MQSGAFQERVPKWKFGNEITSSKQMTWGNGWITDLNSQYKAQYDVWMANGKTYLFFPWISGDVTIRGQKPQYYVLQRM